MADFADDQAFRREMALYEAREKITLQRVLVINRSLAATAKLAGVTAQEEMNDSNVDAVVAVILKLCEVNPNTPGFESTPGGVYTDPMKALRYSIAAAKRISAAAVKGAERRANPLTDNGDDIEV